MSRHLWRQAASPAPRWAWPCAAAAMASCCEAGPQRRRRGSVQAEATRLYSAGLGASQRALTGASVSGIPEGRFSQEKAPSQTPQKGMSRNKSCP